MTVYLVPRQNKFTIVNKVFPETDRDIFTEITVGELDKTTARGWKVIPSYFRMAGPRLFLAEKYALFHNKAEAAQYLLEQLEAERDRQLKLINDVALAIDVCREASRV